MIKLGMFIGDRYEILEKVGSGGMADVYKARCHRLNRNVAIKILKQEYSQDTKFVNKFRTEAQSVAVLSHPNVVGIYDVGEDNGLHYIVMELIEGITLKKYIERKGKLPVNEAVGIALQIARGLEAAHNSGIVHRDIKPQNILLSNDGKAKITDFGIAKAASSNTITSNAMGSVHYISPEQARGGFSDEKSDIYSLGVSMYEMLSGRLPFGGESAVAIAMSHIQDEAVSLTVLDPEIPTSLANIVNKCMQKKPEMRYLSAAALITDLQNFLVNPDGNYGVLIPLSDDSSMIFIDDDDARRLKDASGVVKGGIDLTDEKEEDEDESDIDPKLEKALVFGSIAVAIIIGLVLIFFVAEFLGLGKGSSSPTPTPAAEGSATPTASAETGIDMPDLVNKTENDAIIALNNLGVSYTKTEEASDLIEKGNVISTNPAYGEKIPSGSSVELVISSGATDGTVPDVIGKSLTDAETLLTEKGFKVVRGAAVYSDTVAIEKVASTDPGKGEEVEAGATITIHVSKGKENAYVKVPNLSNKTKQQAIDALKKLGLKKGTVTSDHSPSIAKGKVCAQSLAYGSEVELGTSVDFTVSLGPETTYSYVGKITISTNPFEYATDPAAEIKLVLSQDGYKSKEVYRKSCTYASFPLTVNPIVGYSDSEGEIIMYKDGARVGAFNISFTKVAN